MRTRPKPWVPSGRAARLTAVVIEIIEVEKRAKQAVAATAWPNEPAWAIGSRAPPAKPRMASARARRRDPVRSATWPQIGWAKRPTSGCMAITVPTWVAVSPSTCRR